MIQSGTNIYAKGEGTNSIPYPAEKNNEQNELVKILFPRWFFNPPIGSDNSFMTVGVLFTNRANKVPKIEACEKFVDYLTERLNSPFNSYIQEALKSDNKRIFLSILEIIKKQIFNHDNYEATYEKDKIQDIRGRTLYFFLVKVDSNKLPIAIQEKIARESDANIIRSHKGFLILDKLLGEIDKTIHEISKKQIIIEGEGTEFFFSKWDKTR